MVSSRAGDIDYGALLLGMLVTQDVQLGLFIAILPTLIQAGAGAHARYALCCALVQFVFLASDHLFIEILLSTFSQRHGTCAAQAQSLVTAVTPLGSDPACLSPSCLVTLGQTLGLSEMGT